MLSNRQKESIRKDWSIGDNLDVLDKDSQLFCPGTVVQIKEKDALLIHYRGWGDSWNEFIDRNDERLQPEGTYVIKCAAWVHLTLRLSAWPCRLYIRNPKPGSKHGKEFLKEEKRIYLEPYGRYRPPLLAYKHGVWMCSRLFHPFQSRSHEVYRFKGLQNPHYRQEFKFAYEEVIADKTTLKDYNFRLDGTFDKEFERLQVVAIATEAENAKIEKSIFISTNTINQVDSTMTDTTTNSETIESITVNKKRKRSSEPNICFPKVSECAKVVILSYYTTLLSSNNMTALNHSKGNDEVISLTDSIPMPSITSTQSLPFSSTLFNPVIENLVKKSICDTMELDDTKNRSKNILLNGKQVFMPMSTDTMPTYLIARNDDMSNMSSLNANHSNQNHNMISKSKINRPLRRSKSIITREHNLSNHSSSSSGSGISGISSSSNNSSSISHYNSNYSFNSHVNNYNSKGGHWMEEKHIRIAIQPKLCYFNMKDFKYESQDVVKESQSISSKSIDIYTLTSDTIASDTLLLDSISTNSNVIGIEPSNIGLSDESKPTYFNAFNRDHNHRKQAIPTKIEHKRNGEAVRK